MNEGVMLWPVCPLQTAYQVGYLQAVAESSLVLWRHFVAQPPPPEEVVYVTSVEQDFKLTLLRWVDIIQYNNL